MKYIVEDFKDIKLYTRTKQHYFLGRQIVYSKQISNGKTGFDFHLYSYEEFTINQEDLAGYKKKSVWYNEELTRDQMEDIVKYYISKRNTNR